jgi:predicted ABC-type ATPase
MGSLLIVTGPPGAGKSTVSRLLAGAFDSSVLVEGDAFFGFLASGAIAPWLPESNVQNEVVTEAAAAATGRFARGDYATVYDGVVGPWFLPTFAHATGLTTLDYVILLPSLERCVAGVRHRVGHVFTDEDATRKMYDEFATASIDDRHVLRDLPGGVDAVVDLITTDLDSGRFAYQVT